MTIVRPPADVARYTMVFHSRDSGNEVNKQRWVSNTAPGGFCWYCILKRVEHKFASVNISSGLKLNLTSV